MSHLDDGFARVVAALKAKDMWENTVIMMVSDNGADVRTGGSNHPLRGMKHSPWEGGTKVPSFVYTPNPVLMPFSRRGTTSSAFGHATDILPTLLGLAGQTAGPSEAGPLDGYDMWGSWIRGLPSPRNEIIYNADPLGGTVGIWGVNNSEARKVGHGNFPEAYTAIRVGQWKLIDGYPGFGDWYGSDPSSVWRAKYIEQSGNLPDAWDYDLLQAGGAHGDMHLGDGGQAQVARGEGEFEQVGKNLWLFDLDRDPLEQHDLAPFMPEKVAEMRMQAARLIEPQVPPIMRKRLQQRGSAAFAQETALLRSAYQRSSEGAYIEWWADSPELAKMRAERTERQPPQSRL
eukprot:gnl/TRDRNA2_/TRDRNA2_132751_c2_seq1.p1 gnl/TRDRNA2_/TRDRNA2_132751_c2~~gnl/TRDRNA2_/TRDRNA2_132751_c2_seq1.p1  ORF type:complete len:404 (+),score=55.92 gnl/TRDRNA2_/TRDRNA2_132751_c2_seq1:179-1213(+)